MDELALTTAISRKDAVASQALFDLYFDPLYRFLRHLTGQKEDAEDLAQQTLIRVIRHADRFDGRVALKSWVYAIAYREFGKWRRRKLWQPLTREAYSNANIEREITDGTILLHALSKLSASQREAFLLHHVEGLSTEEVAYVQKVPAGTVKSRLHSARASLKEILEKEEFYVIEPSRI